MLNQLIASHSDRNSFTHLSCPNENGAPREWGLYAPRLASPHMVGNDSLTTHAGSPAARSSRCIVDGISTTGRLESIHNFSTQLGCSPPCGSRFGRTLCFGTELWNKMRRKKYICERVTPPSTLYSRTGWGKRPQLMQYDIF